MSKRFLYILLFLGQVAVAQIDQPLRFEIPDGDAEYDVIASGDKGLYFTAVTEGKGERIWQVYNLDTLLEKKWNRQLVTSQNQRIVSKYSEGEKFYMLFARTEVKNRDFELLIFDRDDGSVSSYVIRNFIPFNFFDFKVREENIVIAGYYNNRPLVIAYNLQEGVPTVLPGLFVERGELIQLVMDDDRFDIVMSGRNMYRQETILINSYNYNGQLIHNLSLNPEDKKSLLFGMLSKSGYDKKLLAGVYGRQFSEISKGIFLASIGEDNDVDLQYHNYAELKNFFSYMKARREKRVMERISRRRIKNKKIRFSYRLLVHDLMETKDEIILLGEAFYPKYKSVSGGSYSGRGMIVRSYNNGIVNSDRVFEGYQYTHAVVIGFSKEGKLLWDNSFEINDVISFDLKQFVHANVAGDKISLLYVYDDLIRSKTIVEDKVEEGKEITPISTMYEGDQLVKGSTDIKGISSWYDNVFIAFGTQTITNPLMANGTKGRQVFFINKVINK